MLCPILNREIGNDDCFLTATVAEGTTPPVDGVAEILNDPQFPEICLKCKYHPD